MADYTQIDRPYDAVGNRIPGGTSPVINDLSTLFNQPAQASSYTDPTAVGSANSDANYIGIQTTSTPAGPVETQQVNTNQSIANLWINTFIRSKNFKPGAIGFNINGETGSAEFNNVLVRGTIYASIGQIGGWTIGLTTLTGGTIILDSANQRIDVGNSSPHIIIDGAAATIGTSTFVSGQIGWRIDGDGDAEFNNIVARGEFRTSVFTKDAISATGGSFIALEASILLNNFTSVTSPTTSAMDVKDTPIGHAQLFNVNDILRIKDGSGLDNWLKVTAVTDNTTYYTYTVDKQSGTNGTFYAGTAVVDYKTATDGFVLMTSDLTNAPYIDIATNGATPWAGTTANTRLGNLSGITDPIAGALTGQYGLWTGNGYFSGQVQATSGRIGGSTNYWQIGTGDLAAIGSGDVAIRAGQTAYDTGTGFWLGRDTGTAKLSMGVGGGKGLTWDGTDFSFKTGAVGTPRLNIDSSDNKLTFYNASNVAVTQLGGGTFIGTALRMILDSDTTDGISITTSTDTSVGLSVASSANVTVGGVRIDLSSTGTGNDGNALYINHLGTSVSSRGIYLIKGGGAGEALYITSTGTSGVVKIDASGAGSNVIPLSVNQTNSATNSLVLELYQSGKGKVIDITSINSDATTDNSIYISHASTSIPIKIDKTQGGYSIEFYTNANSAGNVIPLKFDLNQAGSGDISLLYAIASKSTGTTFARLESQFYDSGAVGGSQDKKIKVNLGGTAYWIPCYTA